MYRLTKKAANQRAAKATKRLDGPSPDYPTVLPELRRRIVIVDFDFGENIHTLDLYRTNRIDTYRVHVDGKPWKARIGWSKILAGLRKSLPRVGANV